MTPETAPPAPEHRQEMIAIAAYYLAERRGFSPGGAESDWFSAEQMIDNMLADQSCGRLVEQEGARTVIRNALLMQGEPL
ncbi:DUF2934 domain-containing protein [Thiobaca trueperi]|uniref:DUF2934 family protein n=1 Tax=Thiobaca trueperi TaxID=127458 RepID=A0A4V2V1K2_9GAMM|nr:DUF2934 domain-containing protein [Thiobaca trueperi]TCT21502.1 DUF2934 family protein [Thiobaca trueperi]